MLCLLYADWAQPTNAEDGMRYAFNETTLKAWNNDVTRMNDTAFEYNSSCTLLDDIAMTRIGDSPSDYQSNWNSHQLRNHNFDGNGHTISNITLIANSNGQQDFGFVSTLYGSLDSNEPSAVTGGIISNLGLIDIYIYSPVLGQRTGGICGTIASSSATRIIGCYVTGKIETSADANGATGGIVGTTSGGSTYADISGCYSNIEFSESDNVSMYYGGILGNAQSETSIEGGYKIDSCYWGNPDNGIGYNNTNATMTDSFQIGTDHTIDDAIAGMNSVIADEGFEYVSTGDADVPLRLQKI